jgi:hypothetical protein
MAARWRPDSSLELFELFNPSRRSSSAIRAFKAAIPAACARIKAISSSRERSMGDPSVTRFLNLNPSLLSRKIRGDQQIGSNSGYLGSYQIHRVSAPPLRQR